jgi:Zn-dependent protease
MGGTTHHASVRLTRWQSGVISFAGPLAGLLLGGAIYLGALYVPTLPVVAAVAVQQLLWVNISWSIVNLAPVLPFDGGHILEQVLGPQRARTTALVSLVAAVVIALGFAWLRSPWVTVLFLMAAIQSYQLWSLPPGAVLVDPMTGATSAAGGPAGPSPLRKWWLKLRLKRLQAQADSLKNRRRASGPDLRVIKGGADDDPPKDKRFLN